MEDYPTFDIQDDLDDGNVAAIMLSVVATLDERTYPEFTPLVGIVSEKDGGIIAYALGYEHAVEIVKKLNA